MSRGDLRQALLEQVDGFVQELYDTALQAMDHALANITTPSRCASVNLHQVQWHNGEPVSVRLYIEHNAGEGIKTDA